MRARRQLVIEGLHDLVAATSIEECIRRVERQAEALFEASGASVVLRETPLTDRPGGILLRARGRIVGHILLDDSDAAMIADPEELSAFAAHAAIALDNARLLEDHHRRALRDPLTGLFNRGEFQETLARMADRAAGDPTVAFGLVVFDLDQFKSVNDRGGHAAGDRLLRGTSAALSTACRSSDTAFRIGGDEFALILPQAGREEAAAVGRRAAEAIGRLEGSAGVSWGAAGLPEDAMTRDGLLAVADAKMYQHKGRAPGPVAVHGHNATRRLEVACRLAVRLTELRSPEEIAAAVVKELHSAFGYYLAVVHRLHDGEVLRVVAGAGRLADSDANFLAWEQPITSGVNGRVARTATAALVSDTRADPDYLGEGPGVDPGSELSVPIMVDGRCWGVLNLEQLATHAFDENDLLLAEAVVAQTGAALHRCALLEEMELSFSSTLAILCDALESKDPYTAQHAQHVGDLAMFTAQQLGISRSQRRPLRYCALLHDIGKIGVRSELLTKPDRLTAEEYEEVKEHSSIGAALLSRIPLLADIAPLVRSVHERWDGAGYPAGLSAGDIPIEARIVAVCDAWHAMTSDRPYRRALSVQDARSELSRTAGSQFDPAVVRALIAVLDGCNDGPGRPG